MTMLEQAMTPKILNTAWRRLQREHTPWSNVVSRDDLQRHLIRHILECREQILAGTYKPLPLRQFPMAKPDGGQRIISAHFLRDKLVQRSLLIVLEPRAEALFHNDSYGYRPRRSVQDALAKTRERVRIGQGWLVDADITKFFDSIPHKQLLKILKSFIRDGAAMKLIEQWLVQGAHHCSLLRNRRGVCQGSILSPLFCNLYLHQFDTALVRANIPFVRFADDFLLFADTRKKALAAEVFAGERLEELGLSLHPKKTQVVRSSRQVVFLGESLPNA